MYIPPFSIEPTKVVGGCIAIYENVWSHFKTTINEIESVTSNPNSGIVFDIAKTLGSKDQEKRTNSHLSLTAAGRTDEIMRKINNEFFNLTHSAAQHYANSFCEDLPFFYAEGFNLLKYQTGQEYKAHFDGATSTHRSISPILYLNDDYEGGEIEFIHHDVKIKPKAGTLMMFPSSYPYTHIAHPVTSGTKYAIVTWLHDMPMGS